MTGAYLRVQREGRWENVEVEHLTDEERTELFKNRDKEEILNWFNMVSNTLGAFDEALKENEEKYAND